MAFFHYRLRIDDAPSEDSPKWFTPSGTVGYGLFALIGFSVTSFFLWLFTLLQVVTWGCLVVAVVILCLFGWRKLGDGLADFVDDLNDDLDTPPTHQIVTDWRAIFEVYVIVATLTTFIVGKVTNNLTWLLLCAGCWALLALTLYAIANVKTRWTLYISLKRHAAKQ